jgi:hypothetical protein
MGMLPEPEFNFMDETNEQDVSQVNENSLPQQGNNQISQPMQQESIPLPQSSNVGNNQQQSLNNVPMQPQINTQAIQQQKRSSNGKKKYPPRYEFYTKSSALLVSAGDYSLFFEVAPALQGQDKRYNWKEGKITTKMSIEEIDAILDCLKAYKVGGVQGFQQVAKFYNPQGNGGLSFYHKNKNGATIINFSISQKSSLPVLGFHKKENNGQEYGVYYTIIPTQLSTLIRVLDRYANLAISKER